MMIKLGRKLLIAMVVIGALTTTATASAAQINVNTAVDEFNANAAACSLREAIQSANTDSAAQSPGCTAGSGADAIVLRSGNFRATRTGADDDTNLNGDFDIGGAFGALSISAAPGADVVLGSGMSGQSVVQMLATANVSLNGVTIAGGNGPLGGAMSNAGTATLTGVTITGGNGQIGGAMNNSNSGAATLTNVTIRANHSGAFAGGIYNSGTMTVTNSTFANNNADTSGGALQQGSTGSLTVVGSTIRDNFAGSAGGGIEANGPILIDRSVITGNTSDFFAGGLEILSTVSISNSTIEGNRANFGGGMDVLSAAGALTLINTTVVRNSATDATAVAPRGGGIYQGAPAVVHLQDSIIALNTDASSMPGPDCFGSVTSLGHSLLGSNQNCTYAAGPGDIVNVDPQLGPLADNGGPTKSVAPLATSPAIDAGSSALGTDQRGSPRPVDILSVPNSANGSDIGSVEMAAPHQPTQPRPTRRSPRRKSTEPNRRRPSASSPQSPARASSASSTRGPLLPVARRRPIST